MAEGADMVVEEEEWEEAEGERTNEYKGSGKFGAGHEISFSNSGSVVNFGDLRTR